ncbi:Uncharacterized protein K02A2.6 [Stylophora pistillata]|uniref:Uncharacterized protein K02A2.6 n=1 Tax=Stylophora pistillata TaxID=50429 RepID=A0A2B4S905_STYPI|nr:Uncharacterized protein K02A2.6 [Stylophora pistillata]
MAVERECAAELTEKETTALHEGSVEEGESHCEECPEEQTPENGKKKWSTKSKFGKKKKKQQKVHFIEEDRAVRQSVSGSDWPIFTVSDSHGTRKEFIVPVAIDGKTVDMELDTGASVTIIPKSIWTDVLASKPVELTDVKLRSYSGHEIPVIGEARVQVAYRDQEAVLPLVITGNDGPVLMGHDKLSVLKLDWRQIKQISLESVNKLDLLRTKYSSLFDGNLGTIKGVTAHLKLNENAVPQFFKPRAVLFALKEKIADELQRLEKIGVLEKVDFLDWATPIVPMLKPDGSVQISGDYKVMINPVLDVPEHPMPTADYLFTQLNGGEKFTKLDLSSAYQQVLLDEESRQYGVGGILDDLIITGSNDEAHFCNLASTLERMSSMGIKLKKEKCVFMKPSVEYFAFMVDNDGIHPSPCKVQAIQEVPVPENPTELKSFLGLINYYCRFIPDMTTLAQPLNRLLVENIPWKWSKQCQEAFQKLKGFLQSAPLLAHYNPKKPVRLAVDSSSFGLGAVLSHISEDGEEKPIAFASPEENTPEELRFYRAKREEFTVRDGCLLRGTRVVIPSRYRQEVLSELHLNHPGMVRMKSLARLHVWWPNLDGDIEQTMRDCIDCSANRCRVPLKVVNPWIWPTRPWQRLHVDFAGPFNGGMFLIVVDAKSKWIEVIQMSSTTACTTIGAVCGLFATHGLPEEIVADNGLQFVAGEMKDFLTSNGVRLCLSSPYHPASNGEAERAVRTFKEAMRVIKNEPGTHTQKLARFLLSYQTTPHTATGYPPAEILMGRTLRTRLELLRPDLSARMEQKSRRINPMVRSGFEIGEPVMVTDYRNRGSAWTKGVVQDRLGLVTYRVQVEKLLWKRHVDQLRGLAGSMVPDVELNSCEIPEIDLPEKVDASVSAPNQDLSPQQQSMPNEKFTKPWVEVAPPGQSITLEEDVTDNTVPEEPKCRSTRTRLKPKRLIEEM